MEKQLQISTGIIKNASGSAYVELGNLKIICSIQGPRDSFASIEFNEKGKVSCDFKYAPFSKRNSYHQRGEDKETQSISSLLEKIIVTSIDVDSFPKAVVEVYIMVLEVDGDPLGLALMCASLALTNAGIGLLGLLGCSCVSVMKDNTCIVNPTSVEIANAKCYTTLAILSSTKEIAYISHSGAVKPSICASSISKCMEESTRLCGAMRDYLLQLDA